LIDEIREDGIEISHHRKITIFKNQICPEFWTKISHNLSAECNLIYPATRIIVATSSNQKIL